MKHKLVVTMEIEVNPSNSTSLSAAIRYAKRIVINAIGYGNVAFQLTRIQVRGKK